jgi:hypothetical protein
MEPLERNFQLYFEAPAFVNAPEGTGGKMPTRRNTTPVLVWTAETGQEFYLRCIGWMPLDSAVIAGVIVYGYCDGNVSMRNLLTFAISVS